MAKCTPWHAIAKALEAEGVEYVFGLPGNPQNLIEDLTDHTNIKFVLVRNEPWAVSCAYAYARVSGKPGIVFTNPGPGITNLATGLLEATCGSVPVIAIANGVVANQNGMGAFQELDSVALMKPVTKWAVRAHDTTQMPWIMQRAFTQARNGRPGAVFIDVPSDTCSEPVEMATDICPTLGRIRTRPEAADVEAAVKLISQAKRPVMICGSGAVSAAAFDQVRELSRAATMPVFATPGGRGIMAETEDLFMGLTGLYFSESGKAVFEKADLVFSIGSRLEAFSTLSWSIFPEEARFIQLDIDADTIAMNWRPDAALVCDAALGLHDLLAAGGTSLDGGGREDWIHEVFSLKDADLAATEAEAAEPAIPIRPPFVLAALNRVFGHDTILMKENGGADLWCYYWPYYKVLDAGDCVPMAEQTAMGFGVTGSIGAKLANPSKNVVCVTGDGAMQMAMMELATAAEWKCGVTWIVFNNQAFGWPQYTQVLKDQEFVATAFGIATDLPAIAEAQGCKGISVTDPADLELALTTALAANREGIPVLIDVTIERHYYTRHFQEVSLTKIHD
jgi:acetolactate synthase I/II/III large subunit